MQQVHRIVKIWSWKNELFILCYHTSKKNHNFHWHIFHALSKIQTNVLYTQIYRIKGSSHFRLTWNMQLRYYYDVVKICRTLNVRSRGRVLPYRTGIFTVSNNMKTNICRIQLAYLWQYFHIAWSTIIFLNLFNTLSSSIDYRLATMKCSLLQYIL